MSSRWAEQSGISAVLSDLNAFKPNSSFRFLANDSIYVRKYKLGNSLTAYCRQYAKVDKVGCSEQLERREIRVVLRDNHGVIKKPMQPLFNVFQSAKINAPISLV
jgi:hypothetical protein